MLFLALNVTGLASLIRRHRQHFLTTMGVACWEIASSWGATTAIHEGACCLAAILANFFALGTCLTLALVLAVGKPKKQEARVNVDANIAVPVCMAIMVLLDGNPKNELLQANAQDEMSWMEPEFNLFGHGGCQ